MRFPRRFRQLAATVVLAVVTAAPAAAAEVYTIDPSHSHVGFRVSHMMVSQVPGEFQEFTGTIAYDAKDVTKSSAQGTIKAASINTRDAKRDKHLRSPDFFDVENHPEITFQTTAVERRGEQLVALGKLTIRGTTKTVEIPVNIRGPITDPYGNERIGLDGTFEINRKDYGVSWSKVMDNGGLVVGDEVTIELQAEAVRKP